MISEERGLAGPTWAEKGDKLAGANRQGDVVEGQNRAEPVRNGYHLQGSLG